MKKFGSNIRSRVYINASEIPLRTILVLPPRIGTRKRKFFSLQCGDTERLQKDFYSKHFVENFGGTIVKHIRKIGKNPNQSKRLFKNLNLEKET